MNNLGNIEFEGKSTNLNTASLEQLKDLLKKVNIQEEMVKQEIDTMLKKLM